MTQPKDRSCADCIARPVCMVYKSNLHTFDLLRAVDVRDEDTRALIDRGTWKTKTDRITARACEAFTIDPRYATDA